MENGYSDGGEISDIGRIQFIQVGLFQICISSDFSGITL